MTLGASPILHVQLFGGFRLTYGEQPLTSLDAPRLQALLAYLLLHRDAPQARQQLAFLLFPDSSDAQARTNLRNLVHHLRHALPRADQFLLADAQTLQWNCAAPFFLDVQEFEKYVTQTSSPPSLCQAVQLYHGDLLPGCYDDWMLAPRERYRQLYLDALLHLTQHYRSLSEYAQAIEMARRLVAADPANERAHQHLMFCFVALGERHAALQQYERCVVALQDQVDALPLPETTALYEWIKHTQTQSSSLAARITNLPIPLTSFVGRENEMAEIKRLLTRAENRMGLATEDSQRSYAIRHLTLTGAGGSGKTRLAIQVATDLIDSFRDGVWWVELAGLTDPALVPQTVAKALGVRESAQQSLFESLTDFLRAKQLLLALDNCEHLLDACAQLIRALLSACPHLQILATSREPLGFIGETVRLLSTLAFPDPKALSLADLLLQYPAVRLFVERVRALDGQFEINAENAAAVAHICARLDGIPLALELAAARGYEMSAPDIAAHLDHRFTLLTRGNRGALPRQQTLGAAMDWSYNLLSPPEQMLFRRLSVFAGGFTLESVEQVCADDNEIERKREGAAHIIRALQLSISQPEILDLLSDLVDKSLVVVAAMEEGEQVRYRLLEPVQQYASQKLAAAGEIEQVRNRHAEFFLRLANETTKIAPAKELAFYNRLEQEHANLSAAMNWALEKNASETILKFSAALGGFWDTRGYWQESIMRYEMALEHVSKDDDLARARLYQKISAAWIAQRQVNNALDALQAAEAALNPAPDEPDQSWWYEWLELRLAQLQAYYFTNDLKRMLPVLDQAGPILSKYGTADQRGRYHANRVRVGNRRERYDPSAETLFDARASLAAFVESGNPREIADATFRVGFVLLWQGDLPDAETHLKAALEAANENGDVQVRVLCLTYLAVVCRMHRQDDAAQAYAAGALEAASAAKMAGYVGIARANLGWVAYRRKNVSVAETEFRSALELWKSVPTPYPFQWLALVPLVAILLIRRELNDAIDCALRLLEPSQAKLPDMLSSRLEAAIMAADQGHRSAALTALRRAIQTAHETGYF